MAKPVEINIPSKASSNAQASIPADNVPDVAKAMRRAHPELEEDGEKSDEEVVADALMAYARETVRNEQRQAKIREVIEQADQDNEAGF